MSDSITGIVERVVYHNEDNGYTVLALEDDITVTGNFPRISEGESLRLWGEFVVHEVYGEQFAAKSFEIVVPTQEEDILRYLGSGAIKGVGPALAKRIVDKFGKDTFKVLENTPEELAKVKGISEAKAMDIADAVLEKTRDRSAILYLMKFGIKNNLAMRIYKYYGQKIYSVIESNPYKLAEDIRGIGFKAADEIAKRTGITYDSAHRIKSGILYVLSAMASQGHTYLPRNELIKHSSDLLFVDEDSLSENIMQLSIERKITIRQERVYLSVFYKMEQDCASMLYVLSAGHAASEESTEKFIKKTEKKSGFKLDEKQKQAVMLAASCGFCVLTGGPGTGKTTTIRTIIEYFESFGLNISLCAPTGRAAKRMTESTGREAMTIHRLLEVKSAMEEDDDRVSAGIFTRNEKFPLETDVVIADEASMVDITLFYALLKAIPMGTKLLLVGDADQLPSVGPGNVLRDIIDSGSFKVVRLTNIFRQSERSDIVLNAHRIQNNEEVPLDNNSKDFFFLSRFDVKTVNQTLLSLILEKLPSYVSATEFDIQVLTPGRKGQLGVEELNKTLQSALNPPSDKKRERNFGSRIFREGDKVMQIKNNYRLPWRIEEKRGYITEEGAGIFNGDIGRIISINEYAKELTVLFDDEKLVDYPYAMTEELEHAFAVTVHKSQGSEYPAVVIPLLGVPKMLINRNLIYTAITRAVKCVVLVGSPEIFREMAANDRVLKRYSGLLDAIKGMRQG